VICPEGLEDLKAITCEELSAEVQELIHLIRSDIELFEERYAIIHPEDGKTTIQRALEALERRERFHGEHQVALAYLQSQGARGARFARFVK